VVTVQRAAGEDDALALASDVDYALAASVWTADAGVRCARRPGCASARCG
jgi:acyl-CoA reductase-like NAD-dependent aldehyde dehydrogenase